MHRISRDMSWEVDRTEEKTCPCGKGHYTATYRSNDWGQHSEQVSMECLMCQSTHGLYVNSYTDRKGLHVSDFLWVPKRYLHELNALERDVEKRHNEIAMYLEARYGAQWLDHFEKKSKKSTWEELTDNGSAYPQLSTFYAHVRSSGLERVLKSYLRYDNVSTITRILRLRDAELTSRIGLIADLIGKAVATKNKARGAGFR